MSLRPSRFRFGVLLQGVSRGGSSIGGEKSSLDESRGIVKETGHFKMAERVGFELSRVL